MEKRNLGRSGQKISAYLEDISVQRFRPGFVSCFERAQVVAVVFLKMGFYFLPICAARGLNGFRVAILGFKCQAIFNCSKTRKSSCRVTGNNRNI